MGLDTAVTFSEQDIPSWPAVHLPAGPSLRGADADDRWPTGLSGRGAACDCAEPRIGTPQGMVTVRREQAGSSS